MRTAISISLILAALAAHGCTQPPHEALEEIPKPRVAKPLPTKGPTALAADSATKQLSEKLKARTDQLLKQLGSENYKERERAQAELQKLLAANLAALHRCLLDAYNTTKDAEVKMRLERLLPLCKLYTRWQITPAVMEAIPDILKLVTQDSRKNARTMIEALRKLEIKDTRGVLFAILLAGRVYGERRTIEALVEKADSQVTQTFVSLLGKGENARLAACYALQRIGEPVVPSVAKLLRETHNRELSETIVGLLADLGEEGRRSLVQAFRAGGPLLRNVILQTWQRSNATAPFDVLAGLAKDESPLVRAAAAKLLGRIKHPKSADTLISLLKNDKDFEVRRASAQALGRIREKRAVPVLINALKAKEEGVRALAVCALGEIGDERAVKAIIVALDDPEKYVREEAYQALSLWNFDRAIVPEVVKSYGDAGPHARAAIIEFIGRVQGERALPMFLNALKDKEVLPRKSAACVLGWLKARQAVDPLIKALKEDEWCVRMAAAKTLGQIGDKRAVEPLLKALEDEEDTIRLAAVEALGEIGDSRAVPSLCKVLKDKEFDIRYCAAWALMKIGDERAFEPLLELHKDGELCHNYVLEALVRIGGKKAIPHIIHCDLAIPFILTLGEDAVEPLLEACF